jgi:hypothetical protein
MPSSRLRRLGLASLVAFAAAGLLSGFALWAQSAPPPGQPEPKTRMRPIEDPPPAPEPEPDPQPPPPPPPPSPPAAQIRGYTSCPWGSPECSPCVPDVHAALSTLRTHGDVAGFNLGPAPDVNVYEHWQGIQRLTFGEGRLMAVSRSGANTAFVMVEMASRAADGLRLRSNRIRVDKAFSDTQPPPQDVVIQVMPNDAGFNHAGGMQAVGRVLAVPLENSDSHSSRVVFYDVGTRLGIRRLHQTELSSPAVYQDPGHSGAVAVAKLADSRYLMIVAGNDSRTADFYLSSTTSLLLPSTTFSRFFVRSTGFDRPFQNLNLIPQCDGRLFLAGNYNDSAAGWDGDWFRWYELSNGTGSAVNVTFRGERHMVCTYRNAQQCNLVAAGGLYVDPAGRLIGYSTEHDNDGPGGSIKMEEFRNESPQACPTIDTAWVELYDDRNFGDRSVMIDFPDRTLRNYENYDQVEGFEDKTSSARWCIPPGWRLRLFKNKNPCSGATHDLTNSGSQANFDNIGFGDDVSCSRWMSP